MRLTHDQARAVRTARVSAGLTQEALARKAGYATYRIVTAAERTDDVSEEAVAAICRVLGLAFVPSRPAEIGEPKDA